MYICTTVLIGKKTWCERRLKSSRRTKKKTLLTCDTTKRCCFVKFRQTEGCFQLDATCFESLRIRLATRLHFLNTWRAATVSLGNFSLLRNCDVGWLEECSGGGHHVTAGRAQSRVSLSRNERNIESWTSWCESEDSRILFVEDDDTLFPSDYSAWQMSIKGRALGCSATLYNRCVCFHDITSSWFFFFFFFYHSNDLI